MIEWNDIWGEQYLENKEPLQDVEQVLKQRPIASNDTVHEGRSLGRRTTGPGHSPRQQWS
jgi:hypothetical protein